MLILIILLFSTTLVSQINIENDNKAVRKFLKKAGIQNTEKLSELEVPQELLDQTKVNCKLYNVEDSAYEGNVKYIYLARVTTCRAGGCCASSTPTNSYENPEYFDYIISYNKNLSLNQIKVFNYQATHGQEITSRGWLKQFINYDGSEYLEADKNIDALSGATISVNAIINSIELSREIVEKSILQKTSD